MICGCIAGAVGGAIGGAFRAVSWGYNMPGIATLPAYFKAGHMTQFIGLFDLNRCRIRTWNSAYNDSWIRG